MLGIACCWCCWLLLRMPCCSGVAERAKRQTLTAFSTVEIFAQIFCALAIQHDALYRTLHCPINVWVSALQLHTGYLGKKQSADLESICMCCRQICSADSGGDVIEKPANVFVLGNGEQLALPEVCNRLLTNERLLDAPYSLDFCSASGGYALQQQFPYFIDTHLPYFISMWWRNSRSIFACTPHCWHFCCCCCLCANFAGAARAGL
jgi:hypothetical protein